MVRLHEILEKSEKHRQTKKDITTERLGSQTTKDTKKEKKGRNKKQRPRSRSRSPVSKTSATISELNTADIVNVQADESKHIIMHSSKSS